MTITYQENFCTKDSLTESNYTKVAIVRIIDELNANNIKPTVHGLDLFGFGDNYDDLLLYMQRLSPIKYAEDLRRILLWKLNVLKNGIPLSSIQKKDSELLYDAIFNYNACLENFRSDQKKNIVIFRRGQSGSRLTNLLKTLPNVNITIVVSGTDDALNWHDAAREFSATGVPGAGKALLDLARDRYVKEFLTVRINGGKKRDDEIAKSFNFLVQKLIDPSANIGLSDEMDFLYKKAMRMSIKKRIELAKYLQEFTNLYHSEKQKNKNLKFIFRNIPIRNLVIVGAYYYLKKNAIDTKCYWQEAINTIGDILGLSDGDNVILPTDSRQHLIAVKENGLIYFSEADICKYSTEHQVCGLWLINKTVNQNYILKIENILNENGITLEKVINDDGIQSEYIRKVNREYVFALCEIISNESSTEGKELTILSHDLVRSINKADVILFSGDDIETHIAGSLIVPGLGEVIKGNKKALKIILHEINSDNQMMDSNEVTDKIYRYLCGKLKYNHPSIPWYDIDKYLNYLIVGISGNEENKHFFPCFDIVEKRSNGKISAIGLNISHGTNIGFFSSSVLLQAITSILTIHSTNYKISNNCRLVNKFIDGNELSVSQQGLFRNDEKVNHLINEIIEFWSEIVLDGAFVFDVDMTILPKGDNTLNDYKELAYLFMRLLREKVNVAIISGNSEEAQMNRIFEAIKSEMKDDISALTCLTFYVNGGATKFNFDKNGNILYDELYNERNSLEINLLKEDLNTVLIGFSKTKFGLKDNELESFISEASKNHNNLLVAKWLLEDVWEPKWLTIDQIDSFKREGKQMDFPWVEVRAPRDNVNKHAACIAIRPIPIIKKDKYQNVELDVDKRGELQNLLKSNLKNYDLFNVRSGGSSTIDISSCEVEKSVAIEDYIDSNNLNKKWVFYVGDEFYVRDKKLDDGQIVKQPGNDQVIAERDTLKEIRTIAVNHDNTNGANPSTIWIGRSPQATLEFFEEILISPLEAGF